LNTDDIKRPMDNIGYNSQQWKAVWTVNILYQYANLTCFS